LIRLLFSSAGRRVELVNCFRDAATSLGVEIQVHAIDLDPLWSPACKIADYAHTVPRCTSRNFISDVISICKNHEVDLIIPTIDTELMVYARAKRRLAQIGTDVLVSEPDVIEIARDKRKTAEVLTKEGIPVPETWKLSEALKFNENIGFPLLLKPKDGSCSEGIITVESLDALIGANLDATRYIAQKVCQGQEYTINAYYTPDGRCVSCVPHLRILVRDGEVCFAETVRISAFTDIAHQFSKLKFPIFLAMDGRSSGDSKIFYNNYR